MSFQVEALEEDILSAVDLVHQAVQGDDMDVVAHVVLLVDGVGVCLQDGSYQFDWILLSLFCSRATRTIAKHWSVDVILATDL